MSISVHDVATRIVSLQLAQNKTRRGLAGLASSKLHKLAYLCQAYHLAWHGEPLFSEEVRAANSGPVVLELFPHHRDIHTIEFWPLGDPGKLDEAQAATIRSLFEFHDHDTGLMLGRWTSTHVPWLRAREKMTAHDERPVITHADMGAYYRALMDAPSTHKEYAARFMDRYAEVGAKL
ncbi:Panacea domain-containing protein [Arthrobacter sp. IK3]|uniref:Panacea domain-containing protein n=1 Tax=Arthrobacter sp. IK3 TaxID=3448169 RepID=UPI003EDEB22C